MILYLFCNWFGLDFVTTFVLCVLLLAFDFWTVKNVTGRLLVGLRWWNRIRDDGANEWIFESHPVREPDPRPDPLRHPSAVESPHRAVHGHPNASSSCAQVGSVVIDAMDSRIFWGALYGAPAVWFLFSFLAIIGLKLDWLLICAVGLSLTGANVYGYFKCSTVRSGRPTDGRGVDAESSESKCNGPLPLPLARALQDAQRQLQATLTSGALSFFPGGGNGGILSTVAAAAGTNALTLVAGAAAASALSGTQAARAVPTTATAPTLLDAAPTSSRFQGAPDGLTVEPLSPSGTRVRPLATVDTDDDVRV